MDRKTTNTRCTFIAHNRALGAKDVPNKTFFFHTVNFISTVAQFSLRLRKSENFKLMTLKTLRIKDYFIFVEKILNVCLYIIFRQLKF